MFYILACFIALLFIRTPIYVVLVFVDTCSVFLVVLVNKSQYLPSDWLKRLL